MEQNCTYISNFIYKVCKKGIVIVLSIKPGDLHKSNFCFIYFLNTIILNIFVYFCNRKNLKMQKT